MSEIKKIRVGSRKSELALIQTRHVISLLKAVHPEKEFEIVTMNTLGDKVLDIPLPKIGEKSLFTKELETALASGDIDFVVHSLKDLPTTLPDGMAIGAVLTREDPRDALVLRQNCCNLSLDTLPTGSTIGTSSLRRTAQLARKYPNLKVENIRGNLNTRLRKLDELGKYEALILAAAGLFRMGWHKRVSKVLDSEELLYAVGQGALAVECRFLDKETISLLRPLYDPRTALQVIAERSYLRTLGGGCSAPVAVTTHLIPTETKLKIALTGAVWSLDGKEEILDSDETFVEVKNSSRCSKCPYGYNSQDNNSTSCSQNNCSKTDIECLKECSFNKNNSQNEDGHVTKKAKLNHHRVPVDVLKNDPHTSCPVEIPVGADFMGKCPYLEINPTMEGSALPDGDYTKCPYLKENKIHVGTLVVKNDVVTANNSSQAGLYAGLVSNVDVPEWCLKEAEELGCRLAKKLMERGAVDVMTKAQNIIRST